MRGVTATETGVPVNSLFGLCIHYLAYLSTQGSHGVYRMTYSHRELKTDHPSLDPRLGGDFLIKVLLGVTLSPGPALAWSRPRPGTRLTPLHYNYQDLHCG